MPSQSQTSTAPVWQIVCKLFSNTVLITEVRGWDTEKLTWSRWGCRHYWDPGQRCRSAPVSQGWIFAWTHRDLRGNPKTWKYIIFVFSVLIIGIMSFWQFWLPALLCQAPTLVPGFSSREWQRCQSQQQWCASPAVCGYCVAELLLCLLPAHHIRSASAWSGIVWLCIPVKRRTEGIIATEFRPKGDEQISCIHPPGSSCNPAENVATLCSRAYRCV